MDWDSDNYVFQVEDKGLRDALLTWLKTNDFSSINVGKDDIDEAIHEVIYEDQDPVPLSGLKNVWCTSIIFNDEIATINIVKTYARDR